jgi:alkyl hydroperoxide reductase subunit AhpC
MFVSSQESGKGKLETNVSSPGRGRGTHSQETSREEGSKGGSKGGEGGDGHFPMIGETFPSFTLDSNCGNIKFDDWLGDSWGVLFLHPKAFTPVCTTELCHLACQIQEFEKRNCKIAALTCDSCDNVSNWMKDIRDLSGKNINFPIFCDSNKDIVRSLGILTQENMTSRGVYFIGPQKVIKGILLYPDFIGRNYDEVLRILDALMLHCSHHVATPVNWHKGEKCLVPSNVKEEEVQQKFGNVETLKPYLRMTEQGCH